MTGHLRSSTLTAAAALKETGYVDARPIGAVALEVASTNDRLRRALADVFASWVGAAAARVTAHGVQQRRSGTILIPAPGSGARQAALRRCWCGWCRRSGRCHTG